MGSLVSLRPNAGQNCIRNKGQESGLLKIYSKGRIYNDDEKRIQSQASDGG